MTIVKNSTDVERGTDNMVLWYFSGKTRNKTFLGQAILRISYCSRIYIKMDHLYELENTILSFTLK